jgi:hypothetical protein
MNQPSHGTARNREKMNENQVSYSDLPRLRVTSNRPSLKDIFLLGWQHFIPRFPEDREPRAR